MLEIDKLTHTYGAGPGAYTAIEDLSLTVADGELVSIVGSSGCGKSTLLRAVAGLLRPTSGRILLDDAPVDGVPERLAVVFQDYARSLLPWQSVRGNVTFPLRRRGRGRAELREVADAALEEVGLAEAADKYPWQLSGGMQQRVAIARALAYRPSLLLMDEPFGSVDAQTREDLEDLLLATRKRHDMTILLVTHDIDESVYVGDKVVALVGPPGRVGAELPVGLPAARDQISTRQLPEFIQLRTTVGRLIRGTPATAA